MKPIYFTYKGYEFRLDEHDYTQGSPGKVSGPPETCFPPEPPELEIVKLYIKDYMGPNPEDYKEVPAQIIELLNELSNDDFYMTVMEEVDLSQQKEEPDYEPRDSD